MEEVSSFWSNRLTWQVYHFLWCKWSKKYREHSVLTRNKQYLTLHNLWIIKYSPRSANTIFQVFFCSMLAAFTTNLFNSSFSGFHYSGSFGLLRESNILFKSTLDILNNITIFLPTVKPLPLPVIYDLNYRYFSVLSVAHLEVSSFFSTSNWCVSKIGSKSSHAIRVLSKSWKVLDLSQKSYWLYSKWLRSLCWSSWPRQSRSPYP